MKRGCWPAIAAVLCGCGHYADFTLPAPDPSGSAPSAKWEVRPEPVLGRGAPGEWDSADALNPAVVVFPGGYFNLYSGFDGKTWRTGLATSPDGVVWRKLGPVLAPDAAGWEGGAIAANGTALLENGEFLYWYQAGSPPRIGRARSRDGKAWTKLPRPVLEAGPRGSWDERGVGDPCVIRATGRYYLFYLGVDRARRQRLGVARSTDGVTWQKLRANPVLELGDWGAFDENGLGEPAVWSAAGRYWMLYTGRDRQEMRRIGLATSRDGVRWEKVKGFPLLGGGEAWDSKAACDPAVEVTPQGVRVWFGGGDVAHPAENIQGVIGLAWLK